MDLPRDIHIAKVTRRFEGVNDSGRDCTARGGDIPSSINVGISLTTEVTVDWRVTPALDAAAQGALRGRKPFVLVAPPTAWVAAPVLAALDRSGVTLALVPDGGLAEEITTYLATSGFDHLSVCIRGLGRTRTLIGQPDLGAIIGTSTEALHLIQRSALSLDLIGQIAILWPEVHPDPMAVDTIVSGMPQAQRIILTGTPETCSDLIQRYAHRAPITTGVSLVKQSAADVRYAVVSGNQVPSAVNALLDVFNPRATLIWDPAPYAISRWRSFDADPTVEVNPKSVTDKIPLAVATDFPDPAVLAALGEAADSVVILVRPAQVSYLDRVAASARTVSITHEADRARSEAAERRRAIRATLDDGNLTGEMLSLAPLFDAYDPALVAAAIARSGSAPPPFPSWVQIRLDRGRKDRLRPGDVVGALLNAVGIPREHVGRVEVRDTTSTVEVRLESAKQVLAGLANTQLRGHDVTPSVESK